MRSMSAVHAKPAIGLARMAVTRMTATVDPHPMLNDTTAEVIRGPLRRPLAAPPQHAV